MIKIKNMVLSMLVMPLLVSYIVFIPSSIVYLVIEKTDKSRFEESLKEQKNINESVKSNLISINEKKLNKSAYEDQKKDIQVLKDQNQELMNTVTKIDTSLSLLLQGYKKNGN